MPRLAHGSATARNRRLSSPRIFRRSRTETVVQAPLLSWSVATAASISAREEARAEPVTIWGLRAVAVVIGILHLCRIAARRDDSTTGRLSSRLYVGIPGCGDRQPHAQMQMKRFVLK